MTNKKIIFGDASAQFQSYGSCLRLRPEKKKGCIRYRQVSTVSTSKLKVGQIERHVAKHLSFFSKRVRIGRKYKKAYRLFIPGDAGGFAKSLKKQGQSAIETFLQVCEKKEEKSARAKGKKKRKRGQKKASTTPIHLIGSELNFGDCITKTRT